MKLSNQGQIEKLRVDLPTLQAIAARTGGKGNELKPSKRSLPPSTKRLPPNLLPNKRNRTSAKRANTKNRHSTLTMLMTDGEILSVYFFLMEMMYWEGVTPSKFLNIRLRCCG